MFDKVLADAVLEAQAVTKAIGNDGAEIEQDLQLIEHVQAARQLMADPEYIGRLKVHLDGNKTGHQK